MFLLVQVFVRLHSSTGNFTSTTLLGNDTAQTISNKTIIIKDGDLRVTGSSDTAKIALLSVTLGSSRTHIYRLPDYGTGVAINTT